MSSEAQQLPQQDQGGHGGMELGPGPIGNRKGPKKGRAKAVSNSAELTADLCPGSLFLTLAWPKRGVSDTSFELFPIFLIHFSLTAAITAAQPDRVLPQAYASPGAALLMLYLGSTHVRPGPAGALASHVADV